MDARQPDVITVAVTRVDGGLTIMRVVTTEYAPGPDGTRVVNWTIDPTPEYIDKIIAKHAWVGTPHEAVSWRIVPNDFLDEATDKTFRNAWKDTPGRVKPDVDMPKAREIHRDNLREKRAPLLEALDTDYLLADEQNDQQKKRDVAVRKQALRDITIHPDIEAATTPEELKLAGLSVLEGK